VILFLALAASTVFRLSEPVRRWWFPAAPIGFIVLSALIALLILMHDPLPALAGVALVFCGIPVRRFILANQPAIPLVSERS
jgi:APA family basic amino acid/polyamine antiporter